MDREKVKRAFASQRNGARRRGIRWELTFDQWLTWWGADLARRGQSPESLHLQRVADTGPYALGNIRKGHPRDNSKTMGVMRRKRLTELARLNLERARDQDPGISESPEEQDDVYGAPSHKVNLWEPKY